MNNYSKKFWQHILISVCIIFISCFLLTLNGFARITCYKDNDRDGYGDKNNVKVFKWRNRCIGKWVTNNTDCNDSNKSINPGIKEEKNLHMCNDQDDDCDGEIDENLKDTCYKDIDGDGCGDPNNEISYCIIDGLPSQCVPNPCDCDDSNPDRFYGNPEIQCDGKDQDCDNEDECKGSDCITISDIPLEALANPAPPLIVFVLDDSGSMDWDIMTQEKNGVYYKPGGGMYYYVFSASDNKYGNVQETKSENERYEYYKTRCYEYNRIYYKPTITYEPWPGWEKLPDTPTPNWSQVPNAHPRTPRIDPMNTNVVRMQDTYVNKGVDIKNAHYFIFSKDPRQLYLVNINLDTSMIEYYKADRNGDKIRQLTRIPKKDTPEDVVSSRTFEEELQNFANWFSFYRKRMQTSKAAIGNAISTLEGIKVGLLTINNNKNVMTPVLPIKCKNGSEPLNDETDKFLNILYKAMASGGTPLRRGLENAGKYFHESGTSSLGKSPYAKKSDGGECQQSFSIVITDGWWGGSSPSVGNADGNQNSAFDTACFNDGYQNTLADVAMYYYETDLSKNLGNKVPPRSGDSNSQQHMVTFSVSFGQIGTLDPFEDYPSCPAENETSDCSDHCPDWPKPQPGHASTIDDLWHAAVNGRGEFFSASNPQDLIHAMESIGRQISVVGSAAAVAVNGQKFERNSMVFQGSYNSSDWSGDIKAFGTTGGSDFDYDKPIWSAQEKLDDKDWEDRVIITSKGGKKGILLNKIDDDLLSRIHKNNDIAKRIIRYISGDDSEEQKNGGNARTRYHKLGDIVHSHPLFFKNYIFIGANDGMGHVFNAETGDEIAAYVPNLVFENLIHLYQPSYSHLFYCNATPTVKATGSDTYLVGGLGKGGRGYYCLNVTATNYVDMPQWEFPPYSSADKNDDVDMGYSYSTPYISNTNANNWVVIFGNGYASEHGKAALYVRDLTTGQKITTIDTKSGSPSICNGLSSPSLVDIDFDQKVDYVYAGDMIGNLWKFDLTSSNPGEWKVAYGTSSRPKPLFQAKNADGSKGTYQPITSKPDVMAHCVHGNSGYIVIFGTGRYLTEGDTDSSIQQSVYAIWDWQNDERDHTFFYGEFTKDKELSNAKNLPDDYQKIKLLEQKVDSSYQSDNYHVVTDNQISWFPTKIDDGNDYSHVGWFFNLPTKKERIIDNIVIREGKVFFITLTPSTSRCGNKSHSSMYILDACNGGRLTDPVVSVDDQIVEVTSKTPGKSKLPPSAVIFDSVVKPPAFIHTSEGKDRLIFGDMGSNTDIPSIEIESEQGRYYWKF